MCRAECGKHDDVGPGRRGVGQFSHFWIVSADYASNCRSYKYDEEELEPAKRRGIDVVGALYAWGVRCCHPQRAAHSPARCDGLRQLGPFAIGCAISKFLETSREIQRFRHSWSIRS